MKSTSPSEEGEERAAGGVLYREDAGRRLFLLLRHQQGGHWGIPKGRIEAGETELEAAAREVREETGIVDIEWMSAAPLTSRYPIVRDGRRLQKTVVYVPARALGAPVTLSGEHTDARWATATDALRVLTHAESRRVLRDVDAALVAARPEGGGAMGEEVLRAFAERREAGNEAVLGEGSLVLRRFFALDHDAYQEGALSAKAKELQGLVASAVLRCDDCVSYHLVQAQACGATRAEVVESLTVALVVGGSIVIPHLRRAFTVIDALWERGEGRDGAPVTRGGA